MKCKLTLVHHHEAWLYILVEPGMLQLHAHTVQYCANLAYVPIDCTCASVGLLLLQRLL